MPFFFSVTEVRTVRVGRDFLRTVSLVHSGTKGRGKVYMLNLIWRIRVGS